MRVRGAFRLAVTMRRLAAATCAVAALLLLGAPTASAHATLVRSNPPDGSLLSRAPTQVELTFSEDVRVTLASIRVLDGEGRRVDRGNAHVDGKGTQVSVGLRSDIPEGTYVVAWSVVSADTHPIHGGLVFSVGTRTIVGNDVLAHALADRGSGGWAVVGDVARFAHLLGALFAVGAAVYLVLVDDRYSRDLTRWVGGAGLVATLGALGEVPALAAQAAGLGARSITQPGVASQVLSDGEGLSIAVVAVAVVAAWLATRLRAPQARVVAVVVALASLSVSFMLVGHARTTEPRWLVIAADAVHVAAAAIWAGGLAMLTASLRRRRLDDVDADEGATVVATFSKVATVAILAVGAAGLVLAWREVLTPRALNTPYGRLLLIKLTVVAIVAALGAYNHRELVPRITRAERSDGRAHAWATLQRVLRFEILGIVAVLGVTAVLMATQPAREKAGVGGGTASATAPLGTGSLNVVVSPARPGPTQLHVYLLDASGRPLTDLKEVSIELRLPAKDIGPFEVRAVKAGPGHYQVVDATFPYAGRWQVTVDVQIDAFTARRGTATVEIHP